MLSNVKMIVLSHYDFDKDGKHFKGSKVVLTYNGKSKLEMNTSNEQVYNLECLNTYYCDLSINDDLKIEIVDVIE